MNENSKASDNSAYRQNYFFGQKLKELRKGRKISQEKLAQKLGTTRATIANYEAGRASPPFWLAEQTAAFFEVDITLLFEEGEQGA